MRGEKEKWESRYNYVSIPVVPMNTRRYTHRALGTVLYRENVGLKSQINKESVQRKQER